MFNPSLSAGHRCSDRSHAKASLLIRQSHSLRCSASGLHQPPPGSGALLEFVCATSTDSRTVLGTAPVGPPTTPARMARSPARFPAPPNPQAATAAATPAESLPKKNEDTTVLVARRPPAGRFAWLARSALVARCFWAGAGYPTGQVGPTGYIGRYVTKELISRGYKAWPPNACNPLSYFCN